MAAPALGSPQGARPRLLCVDDEPMVLEALRDVLRRSFEVRTHCPIRWRRSRC